MATLSLPNIPTSKMFIDDPEDRTLTTQWQEFFRGLHERVGGLQASNAKEIENYIASETFRISVRILDDRIEELERRLQAQPTDVSYENELNEIRALIQSLPTPKSYDKEVTNINDDLDYLQSTLVDIPETRNDAVVVLDTPKSYDNDIARLESSIALLKKAQSVAPYDLDHNKLIEEIQTELKALPSTKSYDNIIKDLSILVLSLAKEPFKYYLPEFVYDDLQVGISNIRVPASNAPTERLFAHGIGSGVTFPSLGFAVNDYLYFDIQSSHSMKLSTIMDSHIHYCTPTDGSGTPDRFQFQLDVIAAPINGTFAVPSGSPYTAEHTIDADYTTLHKLFELADIAAINTTVSTIYKCKLTRIAATQDEYAGEVYVDYIDSHYQKDTIGSRIEDRK